MVRYGKVLDYLRIGRAQTAAMEMGGLSLAAYLGGMPLTWIPYVVVLALIIHLGGFGMNSASPTDLRLDRQDPAKQDHPIVAGRVSMRSAWGFILALHIIGFIMFGYLTWVTGAWIAWVPFLGFVGLGTIYNLFGKLNKPFAVLEISGAFALAFFGFGVVWTGHTSTLIWAITLYAGLLVAYQIGIGGEVKEIAQRGESNILRRLGVELGESGELLSSPVSTALSLGLTTGKVFTLGYIAVIVLPYDPVWVFVIGLAALLVLFTYDIALTGTYVRTRSKRVAVMGAGEAASYLLLVVAVLPILGWWVLAWVFLPVLWFVVMNARLWPKSGSVFAPGV